MPKFFTTALSRVDECGNYHSPNTCFATDGPATREDVQSLFDQLHGVTKLVGAYSAGVNARLDELEQKGARRGPDGSLPSYNSAGGGRSLGGAIFASDDFQRWRAGGGVGRVAVKIGNFGEFGGGGFNAMITSAPGVGGSVAGLVAPDRDPVPIVLPRRKLTIRDLMAPERTASRSIVFTRETVFTNSADVVSEGAAKYESNIEYEPVTTQVRKIAHWIKISKEALDDAPSLQAAVDGTMRYGLALKEEDQLLYGDGTGENLLGMVPQATAYAAPFTPVAMQMLDEIGLAITQSEIANLPATGIVLNALDWRRLQMLKDSQDRYLGSGPFAGAPGTLWQLPVVPTNALVAGHFLVGAFGTAAQIFDREDAAVLISTEAGDSFTTNTCIMLAEERLALVMRRPQAIISGQFSLVT